MSQDYFSPADIREIIQQLTTLPVGDVMSTNGTPKKTAKATQALNAIRILSDRLDQKKILEFLYTDTSISPAPIARFVTDYLKDTYTTEEARDVLAGLQDDMRQEYFRTKTPFDDPDLLPKQGIFDPTGEFAQSLKEGVEKIISEYKPEEAQQIAQEIYSSSHDDISGQIDLEKLTRNVTEFVTRSGYSTLMLDLQFKDPSKEELAATYLLHFPNVSGILGLPLRPVEDVITERMSDDVYQAELQEYKKAMDSLLL